MNRTKISANTNGMDIDEDDIFPGDAKDMGSGKSLLSPFLRLFMVF